MITIDRNAHLGQGIYLYPGCDGMSCSGYQQSWYLASDGRYGLISNTGLNLGGGLWTVGAIEQSPGADIYPGCDSGCGGDQTSWYLASDSTYGLRTNTGFYAASTIYSAGNLVSGGSTFYTNGDIYMTYSSKYLSNVLGWNGGGYSPIFTVSGGAWASESVNSGGTVGTSPGAGGGVYGETDLGGGGSSGVYGVATNGGYGGYFLAGSNYAGLLYNGTGWTTASDSRLKTNINTD